MRTGGFGPNLAPLCVGNRENFEMSRTSAVKNWYSRGKVAYPDSTSMLDHREVMVSLDEAINVLKSTATKTISVPTDHFGLVEIDKRTAIDKIGSTYLRKNVARIAEEQGVPVGVRLGIVPIKTYSKSPPYGVEPPSKFRVQIWSVGYERDGKSYVIR